MYKAVDANSDPWVLLCAKIMPVLATQGFVAPTARSLCTGGAAVASSILEEGAGWVAVLLTG